MKLLALRYDDHDSNFSYWDGEKLHYIKSERLVGKKHHGYINKKNTKNSVWFNDIKNLFGVSINDVDDVCFTYEPSLHNNEEPEHIGERIDHHYAHALSGWMLSDKPYDVEIVMDGWGDDETSWSVFKQGKCIDRGFLNVNGSIGEIVASMAFQLGVEAEIELDLAGKGMGLQSYGKVNKEFKKVISEFSIKNANEFINPDHWFKSVGDERIANLTKLDWARTVHEVINEKMVEFFSEYCNKDDHIYFSGGVAQNVIFNTTLKKQFPNLVISPHCADDGLSLGCIEWLRLKHNLPQFKFDNFPYVQCDEKPEEVSDETIELAAKALADGKIVGWYQGNGEIGPRALGNRSILMDPRIENGKDKINKVKNREQYRPFGASVLVEHKKDYFWDVGFDSPYMLYVYNAKTSRGHVKLDSITHVDGTCRVQTVDDENPTFRKLLEKFYEITGCAVLLNTSLNIAGNGIAGKISDAKKLFEETDIDELFIGNERSVK